jgi:hypothetical protein
MKYLECDCCGFLAAIPAKDEHDDLDCPFCKRSHCEHGGSFNEVTPEAFIELARL